MLNQQTPHSTSSCAAPMNTAYRVCHAQHRRRALSGIELHLNGMKESLGPIREKPREGDRAKALKTAMQLKG